LASVLVLVIAEVVLGWTFDTTEISFIVLIILVITVVASKLIARISLRPAVSNPGTLFLFFDMSRVTPKLVWDWVRAFCSLAAQEHSWSEIELKRLALKICNVIAVAAKATPEVLGAL
jgi:ABC-type iron transport system FetAB permease component